MSAQAASRPGERGAVLPIVALFFVVLMGFAALTIDVGNTMLHKRRLQAAVDLAVLAGVQDMPNTDVAVAEAEDIADRNWRTAVDFPMKTTVRTGCKVDGCEVPDKLSMVATAEVPTTFARVFGIDSLPVRTRAAACGPCETSTRKFDVMVVLDRSYSMCKDSKGTFNDCYDLEQARTAIKSLLGFFDPTYDRIGLAALSSGDSNAPYDHLGADFPCDSAATSSSGDFGGNRGDFMDGTPDDHDSWVLSPLAASAAFKTPDGALDPANTLVKTVECVTSKGWTPIAPAIQAATRELVTNGRPEPEAEQVIVFLGDGGANVQPMKRDANGNATAEPSWYTASPGNDMRPCADAIGQARIAKDAGIEVYVVGYDLKAGGAETCFNNNRFGGGDVDRDLGAKETLRRMATDKKHFLENGEGEITTIFNAIGRQIVSGGSRLVE